MKPLLKLHPDASNEPLASGVPFDSNDAVLAGAARAATTTASATDIDERNYALALERLEASFYTEGLKRFTPWDFAGGALDKNLAIPMIGRRRQATAP